MWASVMQIQAKSNKPVWPIVIAFSLLILLGHLLTSQLLMEPIVIEINTLNNSNNYTEIIDRGPTILLELSRPMVNALKHNQQLVSRDLQLLRYKGVCIILCND